MDRYEIIAFGSSIGVSLIIMIFVLWQAWHP